MQDLRMRVIEFLNFKQLDHWEMSTGDHLLVFISQILRCGYAQVYLLN